MKEALWSILLNYLFSLKPTLSSVLNITYRSHNIDMLPFNIKIMPMSVNKILYLKQIAALYPAWKKNSSNGPPLYVKGSISFQIGRTKIASNKFEMTENEANLFSTMDGGVPWTLCGVKTCWVCFKVGTFKFNFKINNLKNTNIFRKNTD